MTIRLRCLTLATLSAFALLLLVTAAQAQTTFNAKLTHDQEVSNPPIPDEGSSGFATFVLNAAETQLSYSVQLTGLDLDGLQTPGNPNDNVTRVHFHRAPVGSNGAIVFGIIDGAASFRDDDNPNDLVVNPALGTFSGIWNLTEGQGAATLATELDELKSRLLYFNVHTSDHGGGEIRGQVVPEPTTLVLGVALFAQAACRRLR